MSQDEAPFSLACSIAKFLTFESFGFRASASLVVLERLRLRTAALDSFCLTCATAEYCGLCCTMRPTKGAVISTLPVNCLLATLVGMGIPRPTCHAGRAINSLSALLGTSLPVKAGRKRCLISSSKG